MLRFFWEEVAVLVTNWFFYRDLLLFLAAGACAYVRWVDLSVPYAFVGIAEGLGYVLKPDRDLWDKRDEILFCSPSVIFLFFLTDFVSSDLPVGNNGKSLSGYTICLLGSDCYTPLSGTYSYCLRFSLYSLIFLDPIARPRFLISLSILSISFPINISICDTWSCSK